MFRMSHSFLKGAAYRATVPRTNPCAIELVKRVAAASIGRSRRVAVGQSVCQPRGLRMAHFWVVARAFAVRSPGCRRGSRHFGGVFGGLPILD